MEQLGLPPDDHAASGRGDPRPARHRRPPRPRPAHPLRRPAAAGRHRLGAHHAPAAARPRRADLRPRPDRGRGRAGHPDPAGARPRRLRAAGRAPARAGGAVRRPDAAAGRRRPGARGRAGRPAGHLARRTAPRRAGPGRRLVTAAAERARRPAPGRRARATGWSRPVGPAGRPSRSPACVVRGLSVVHGRDGRRPRGLAGAAARPGHGADGPQRLGQVVAALGDAGERAAPRRVGPDRTGRTRPTSRPPERRALVGLLPQEPSDLLYLETVDEECEAGGPGLPRDPGRAWCRASPATSTRATSPRGSGSRSPCRSCSPAARR